MAKPSIGGHNQISFLHGIARKGSNYEDYFTSADKLDNYNVQPNGYIRRRKGFTGSEFSYPTGVTADNIKKLLVLEPSVYIILTDTNNVYFVNAVGTDFVNSTHFVHIDFSPSTWNRYTRASTSADWSLKKRFDSDLYPDGSLSANWDGRIVDIAQIENKVFAVSPTYNVPFVIEYTDLEIDVYPIYFNNRSESTIYNYLRSIPLKPIPSELDFLVADRSDDLDYADYTKLFISKDETNLATGTCKAWLGLSTLPSSLTQPAHINGKIASLSRYKGIPLFFNVLPTEKFTIDPTNNYDSDDDFTGTVLSNMNTKLNLADVEMSGAAKRAFMQNILFRRKYCMILNNIDNSTAANNERAAYK